MNTSPVSLAEKDRYYECWDMTPRRSLDYSLVNLWGWQEYFGLEWSFSDGLCWIRQTRPETCWWAPLGNWHGANWQELLPALGRESRFTRVPQELVDIWQQSLPDSIQAEEDRDQWEYLYLQSDLAQLSGNKFHRKKNHYNSYVKTYGEPDYHTVTDGHISDVLSVQHVWCDCHECEDSPSLKAENDAITRVLRNWDAFRNMYGGTLSIDNKMIAFSIGEKLDAEMLGVHFEKGLTGYKGVYQAMNLQFAKNAGAGFKWINRAQDMGEAGLRQAKRTYLPADFLRKCKVIYKALS